jgi:hypothetical protein
MANDNDRDDRIPGPDEPESAGEQERAASFAALIDDVIAGKPTPPAMEADQRALLDVAGMVRAATLDADRVRLADDRRESIIDAAMNQASRSVLEEVDAPDSSSEPGDLPDGVIPLRPRILRAAPWMVTAVAAAAAIFLWISRPEKQATRAPAPVAANESAPSKVSADALVGRIDRKASGLASQRLDIIYADRLTLYRQARLSGSGGSR